MADDDGLTRDDLRPVGDDEAEVAHRLGRVERAAEADQRIGVPERHERTGGGAGDPPCVFRVLEFKRHGHSLDRQDPGGERNRHQVTPSRQRHHHGGVVTQAVHRGPS
jgi:hypothetical protein